MAGAVVGGQVPLGVGGLELPVFLPELRLPDGQVQNCHRRDHDHRDDEEQRAIADMPDPLGFGHRIHQRRQPQIQNAAHGPHQVDDGICTAAQRLRGHVGHQRHRGRAIGAHGNQQQPQHYNEQHQRAGAGVCRIAVIQQRDQVHQNGRQCSAAHNERHPPPDAGAGLIGQCAKERQQKQRQYVICRHNSPGEGLVQFKGVGQDQGHHAVVHLPERTDRQKRQAHQNRATVVQLHGNAPS